ncbi:MAG: type I restriction endonuclease subunit R, partial [Bacteroidota bacterium]
MSTPSEQQLEDQLVQQLSTLGYEIVVIKDETALLSNLKSQLEKHNGFALTENEFKKILNHLDRGNVFDKAHTLRGRMLLHKDDRETAYIQFLNQDQWCQNQYQVVQQIAVAGKYDNRYDVTLLINGLPLVQIELKRWGLELKEAFKQINYYQRMSYGATSVRALFQYIQIFVISNGVDTKYFANNRNQGFRQTFFWKDQHNKKINDLAPFAESFLEKCHISKMICKYIVLNQTHKIPMVLRSYQYYATEAIIEKVEHSVEHGYIWHTTGSGKTLTSFKASQIITEMPQVHKVLFVVDRSDLDYQTANEFNAFQEGSVDNTTSTKVLVDQLLGEYKDGAGNLRENKLIVTTIQKLNNAITKTRHAKRLKALRDKRIVMIFDECHRSQFGQTHKTIKAYFKNLQMFGFTGTPIFAKNASRNELGKRTTADLFGKCLHKYVITDAISDQNVLKFSIEYVGKYKKKEERTSLLDIQVEQIDEKEMLDSPKRLEKITDYIIANHDRKTHSKKYSAIFCVSSVDILIQYYELFKKKKLAGEHNLRVANIFSYTTKEEDKDANGSIPEPSFNIKDDESVNKHTREKLDEFIADYNQMFGSKYSTKAMNGFYDYYKNISKRLKDREKKDLPKDRIDILLVVNMFLTGFDAKKVNTLYVDKNLKYHGLIQAFSRTNRIYGIEKSQGNIVCFRNLKKATDDAISLFADKDAKEVIMTEPYEAYVEKYNNAVTKLKEFLPDYQDVDQLKDENAELDFVKKFRELMRLKNVLNSFSEFEAEDLEMDEGEFSKYQSKYLRIRDKVKSDRQKEKVSILEDVDFELELLHREEINVAYILNLLGQMQEDSEAERAQKRKTISDILSGDVQLRSKRELIEEFIDKHLPDGATAEAVSDAFGQFWVEEKRRAFYALCEKEKLEPSGLNEVIERYKFTGKPPLAKSIYNILEYKPSLLQKRKVAEKIIADILEFVERFDEGIGNVENLLSYAEPEETVFLEMELDKSYEEFGNEKILNLFATLKSRLALKYEIRLLLKEEGSIRVTFEMESEEAHQLILAANSGKLVDFGIHGVKLKEYIDYDALPTRQITNLKDKIVNYKRVLRQRQNGLKELLDILEADLK